MLFVAVQLVMGLSVPVNTSHVFAISLRNFAVMEISIMLNQQHHHFNNGINHKKRLSTACTLNNIKFIKPEYGKENKRVISTNNDPRPQHMRSTTSQEITQLQNELTGLGDTTAVALLHVLPSNEAPELITLESLELPPFPKISQLKV